MMIASSCNKVTQKRLEGTWKVKEIEVVSGNTLDVWKSLVKTNDVKVAFYQDGSIRTVYFINEILDTSYEGTYLLSENEAKLVIDLSEKIFNPQGHPLDVAKLRKSSQTLEGRYYLQLIDSTLPADSFTTLRYNLEK